LKEKSPVRLYTVANKIDIGGAKKENVANIWKPRNSTQDNLCKATGLGNEDWKTREHVESKKVDEHEL
jgi:NAD(P)H-nitrite reductase large subunit